MHRQQLRLVRAAQHRHGGSVAVNDAVLVQQEVGVRRVIKEDAEALFQSDSLGDVEADADQAGGLTTCASHGLQLDVQT